METRIAAAAKHLLGARKSGFHLEGLADDFVPEETDVAYAIQDAIIQASGEQIGGWKIAAGTGAAPLCSPLLASAYRASGDVLNSTASMATLVEAEVGVRIGVDLPSREKDYSEQEVSAAIASLHPSLEILGTRFNPALEVPRLLVVADLQNNAAVVVGQPVADWQGLDLSCLGIRLIIGDQSSTIDTGPSALDIVSVLTFLANGRARLYGGLKAGQVVITGSRINAPIGQSGETVAAAFDGLGEVSLRLI